MNTRGVFLFLCLFFVPGLAQAYGLGGELLGSYGEGVLHHELKLNATKNWSFLKLEVGWTGKWMSLNSESSQEINWRGVLDPLTFLKNQSHITSNDAFRLIHKDNYSQETIALLFQNEGFQMGMLQRIPFKKLDVVDAWFFSSKLEMGPFAISGTQLKYSGYTESGESQVLQLEGNLLGGWRVLAAHGWQEDSSGQKKQGIYGEVQKKGGAMEGTFTWQWVEPGFISPLAKTNKITPDRQGGKIELSANLPQGKIALNRRLHSNYAKNKDYNQLSWKMTSLDQKFSIKWRLEPTPAFILAGEADGVKGQFDAWNGTLRLDWQGDRLSSGFRWDVPRQIIRVELQGELLLKWRAIGKYDFAQNRQYCYLSLSRITKSSELKIEFGSYDRGNLLAGFNQTLSVGISWGWKF